MPFLVPSGSPDVKLPKPPPPEETSVEDATTSRRRRRGRRSTIATSPSGVSESGNILKRTLG